MRIGVGINLARVGVLGGDFGVGLGPGGLGVQAAAYLGGIEPYHYLDFITNRMLYAGADVGTVAGGTGYSFTRASDGYYTNSDGTLTLFGSGALRRGDRGVLIEGSRTNLLTYSQEFDDASWTDANTTVSANSTNAPDGTTTADILTATTSTSVGKSKTFTGTAAAYTCSLIAKAGTSSWLRIATSNGTSTINSWFNLSSGATGTTEAGQTSTIVPLSDGYYICSVVRTMAATTCTVFYRFANADNGVTGTSGQTQTWWGAQVELGGFVSSYIPTVAASATRAADVLTYTVNTTAQINAAVAGQPELVTNGGFDSDVSGWTKGDSNSTISWSAGQLVSNSGSTTNVHASQPIATVAGKSYALTANFIASNQSASLRVGTTAGGNQIGDAGFSSTLGVRSFVFRAVGTTTHIAIVGSTANATGTFDNVSVKEVPANSLTLYPLQLWSEFERAVDTGSFEELFNLDDGDSSDRAVLYVGTADLASVDMRTASVSQGAVTVAGAVAVNTVTKLAGRFETNDMRPARGGTLGTADTSCTLPATLTRIVIGNTPPFGYIRRIAVIQGAGTDAQLTTTTS